MRAYSLLGIALYEEKSINWGTTDVHAEMNDFLFDRLAEKSKQTNKQTNKQENAKYRNM